jgi:hypothetical protein
MKILKIVREYLDCNDELQTLTSELSLKDSIQLLELISISRKTNSCLTFDWSNTPSFLKSECNAAGDEEGLCLYHSLDIFPQFVYNDDRMHGSGWKIQDENGLIGHVILFSH